MTEADDERQIRAQFEKYLPSLWALVSSKRKNRIKIARAYGQRRSTINKDLTEKSTFKAQSTIFDLLLEAEETGDPVITFLQFIDAIVARLSVKINSNLQKPFRDLCLSMILKHSCYESEYTSHLAELAVADKLTEGGFDIAEIESRLPGRGSCDFRVRNGTKEFLVEVYNIQFAADRIESAEGLQTFLESRLLTKLNQKIGDQNLPVGVALGIAPVIWGEIMELKPYTHVLKRIGDGALVLPFMVISQYRDFGGKYHYFFQTATEFIEKVARLSENE